MSFRLTERFKGLLFILLMTLYSPMLFAVGFGSIQVYSYLNEPLSAEIKLFGVESFSKDHILAQLGSPENFAQAKLPRPFYLTKLDFDVVKTRDNGTYVYISSSNPIQQPNVEFLVALTWPDGKMLKEFIVLLDPEPASLSAKDRKIPVSKMGVRGEMGSSSKFRPIPKHEKPSKVPADFKSQVSKKVVESINEVSFSNEESTSPSNEEVISNETSNESMPMLKMTDEEVAQFSMALLESYGDSLDKSSNLDASSFDQQIFDSGKPETISGLPEDTPNVDAPEKNMGKIELFVSQPESSKDSSMPVNVIPEPEIVKDMANKDKSIEKQSQDQPSMVDSNMVSSDMPDFSAPVKSQAKTSGSNSSSLVAMMKSLLPALAVIIVILVVVVLFVVKRRGRSKSDSDSGMSNSEVAEDELLDDELDELVDEPISEVESVVEEPADLSEEEPAFSDDEDDMEEEELKDEFDEEEDNGGDDYELKLRLAQQYISVGDTESAVEILQELMMIGDDDTKEKAAELLGEL